MKLQYPIILTPAEEGGFVVTFPDVPEAITQGDDEIEALLNGQDALVTALGMYVDAGEDLPTPSSRVKGSRWRVAPPALAALKLSLYQAMREQDVRKSELARRLGWHMPQVDRVLDLGHASRMDQIESAARALGKAVDVALLDAA